MSVGNRNNEMMDAAAAAHQAQRMDVINKGGRDPDLDPPQRLGQTPDQIELAALRAFVAAYRRVYMETQHKPTVAEEAEVMMLARKL